MKARSWGITDAVVEAGVDVQRYPAWTGELAEGIRVAHQISQRKRYLLWDFHAAGLHGVPMRLVGVDRELPEVVPCDGWDDLKRELSRHRFFVHTAEPTLEDGFNMAVLEAMAAGLPILVNEHPTALVEHGIDGFVARSPEELGGYARQLLADRELAGRLGAAARRKVAERYSSTRFIRGLEGAIATALERWQTLNCRS
jgi:glycosyltransferase involved in cell wall biosynthesis